MPAVRFRWWLLIHRLPAKPLYLRARIRRRLIGAGALPLKDAVYALPRRETCLADLTRIAEEAVAGGGEAYVCEAEFAQAGTDAWLAGEFRSAREADYRALARELEDAAAEGRVAARLARARKRIDAIVRIDFFGAPGRREAEKLLKRLASEPGRRGEHSAAGRGGWTGKTWVTRRGLHVDRIASAWFIRRFLDSGARFRFVDPKAEPARPGEIRFDMVGGDFTHEGDRCTFETLIRRTGVADPALGPIAEIVHDVDIQDGKFGRSDAPGVERIVNGILASQPDDRARLERGSTLFDQLYESFRIGKAGFSKEVKR